MPEDGIVGFKFFETENGLSIVNEAAAREAAERLSNSIAFDNAFSHLDSAISAVQTAARNNAARHEPEPQWDDNVPPDISDGFDFLL